VDTIYKRLAGAYASKTNRLPVQATDRMDRIRVFALPQLKVRVVTKVLPPFERSCRRRGAGGLRDRCAILLWPAFFLMILLML
jgi:hypothetical protein